MITIEQIKKFITGDFSKALLIANVNNNKIDLSLKQDGISFDVVREISDNIPNFELDNDPKQLFEFLFNYYLYNDISGTSYYTECPGHENKVCFKIFGSNNLDIVIDSDIISILPNNFMDRLEQRKRECILECLKDTDYKTIQINNLDCCNTYLSLTGGNYYDDIVYNVLAKKDKNNNPYIPKEEIDLIKGMLEISIEKEKVDYEYLNNVKKVIDLVYSNIDINNINDKEILKEISKKLGLNYVYDLELKLNNSIVFSISNINTLNIFREFLEKYLIKNKDKIDSTKIK